MGLQTSICFTFAVQHMTLPILQITIIYSQCWILFIICQQEQQHLLFGRLHREQTAGSNMAPKSTRTGSSQSCHIAKSLYLLHSLLLSVRNFYACILRHKQTLVTVVAKPSLCRTVTLSADRDLPAVRKSARLHRQFPADARAIFGWSLCPSHPVWVFSFPFWCCWLVGWLQLCLGNK